MGVSHECHQPLHRGRNRDGVKAAETLPSRTKGTEKTGQNERECQTSQMLQEGSAELSGCRRAPTFEKRDERP